MTHSDAISSEFEPPSLETANWDDPNDAEVVSVCGALVAALGGPSRIKGIQVVTVSAITRSMTGRTFDLETLPATSPAQLAETMRYRAEPWRRRIDLANDPPEDVRRQFHVVPKNQDAWEAGSVTAWEQGGISPFQHQHGRDMADNTGISYTNHGASPQPWMI